MAPIDQAADCVNDPWNLPGRSWILRSTLDVQRIHGVEVIIDVFGNEFIFADAPLPGPLNYLVVDVGEILDVANLVPVVFQVATQRIEYHVAQSMADVRR